jgi:isoquinoline 1-oxidoreductase beta subunit
MAASAISLAGVDTVVGPAIGNAIFAACGARVRDLPIRPKAVLAAIKSKV